MRDGETCEEKISKLRSRVQDKNSPLIENAIKRCEELSETPRATSDEFEYYSCECKRLHYAFFHLINAWKLTKKGTLPHEGGYMNQSAPLMTAVSTIDRLMQEYEEEQRKKSEWRKKARRR